MQMIKQRLFTRQASRNWHASGSTECDLKRTLKNFGTSIAAKYGNNLKECVKVESNGWRLFCFLDATFSDSICHQPHPATMAQYSQALARQRCRRLSESVIPGHSSPISCRTTSGTSLTSTDELEDVNEVAGRIRCKPSHHTTMTFP